MCAVTIIYRLVWYHGYAGDIGVMALRRDGGLVVGYISITLQVSSLICLGSPVVIVHGSTCTVTCRTFPAGPVPCDMGRLLPRVLVWLSQVAVHRVPPVGLVFLLLLSPVSLVMLSPVVLPCSPVVLCQTSAAPGRCGDRCL